MNHRLHRLKLIIFPLICGLLSTSLLAQDVYLRLSRMAQQRIGLAIAPCEEKKDVMKVVKDDLDFSLYFNIISPEEPIPDLKSGPDMDGWAMLGAVTLLYPKSQGNEIEINLYDIPLKTIIGKKRYTIGSNPRWTAHKIADDVIKTLTGEDGVAETKVSFSIKEGKSKEIGIVDYDGFGAYRATKGGGLKLFPEFSRKGSDIIFSFYSRDDLWVYSLDLSRHSIKPIIQCSGINSAPTFSPDGSKIAFSGTKDGNPEIYIADRNGRHPRRITHSKAIDTSPSFSPNGRQIAFVSDRAGSPQVYIMDIDGTDVRRLTFEGSYNTSPSWSPKGDLVAYASKENGRFQICITDLSGEFKLSLTQEGNNENPSWSPDGLHLVYSSTDGIYVMHWDGSGKKKIAGGTSPSWSGRF